jgi:branched-chain amino acid transport system permease protein
VERLERVFGGVRAVDGASFDVRAGEVHGLIGPNGAGKTTAINVISGLLRPTGGAVRLAGREVQRLPPHRIAALGVARTFQNIRLFPELSAVDNVLVGAHLVRTPSLAARLLLLPSARAEERSARARADALVERIGLGARAHERARNLSYGEQRRVEIARALASDPSLVLLDEPTAGMNPVEVQAVAALIRGVAGGGRSVLLIEHNVKLVMEVCDRITVLSFGKVIAEGTPAEVARDPAVIAAYLGSGS